MSEVGTSLLNSGPNFTVMLLEEPKYTYGRPVQPSPGRPGDVV